MVCICMYIARTECVPRQAVHPAASASLASEPEEGTAATVVPAWLCKVCCHPGHDVLQPRLCYAPGIAVQTLASVFNASSRKPISRNLDTLLYTMI